MTFLPAPPWQQALCDLVLDRYGVVLDEDRTREVIAPRILAQARQRALSPDSLVDRLSAAALNSEEERWLRELITIGETSFNRDPHQIEQVATFLTQLYQRLQRPLQLWSAACSTGEEPYTLAILLAEANIPGAVLGSDLNEASVRTARAGNAYPATRLRPVPPHWRQKWFKQEGSGWAVDASIRARVRFQSHNLLSRLPPRPESGDGWDAVLCRNVLIYFPPDKVSFVVDKLVSSLSPEGALFLGANEPTPSLPPEAKRVSIGERYLYQRATATGLDGAGPARPAPRPRAVTPAPVVATRQPLRERPMLGDDDLRSRIRYLAEQKMWIALEAVLRDQLGRDNRSGLAWLELGALLLTQHRFADALPALETASMYLRNDGEVWYLRGVAHYKQQQLTDAESCLARAALYAPHFWPAMVLLGNLLGDRGEADSARRHLSTAQEILGRTPLPTLFQSQCAHSVASVHQNPEGSRAAILRELRTLGDL